MRFNVTYWPGTASLPGSEVKAAIAAGRFPAATATVEATTWKEAQALTLRLMDTSDGCLIMPRQSAFLYEPDASDKSSVYVCEGHLSYVRANVGPGIALVETSRTCDVCENEPMTPLTAFKTRASIEQAAAHKAELTGQLKRIALDFSRGLLTEQELTDEAITLIGGWLEA